MHAVCVDTQHNLKSVAGVRGERGVGCSSRVHAANSARCTAVNLRLGVVDA